MAVGSAWDLFGSRTKRATPEAIPSQSLGDLVLHRVQSEFLLHHLDEDRLVLGREDYSVSGK